MGSAAQVIEGLIDPGTWVSWDRPLDQGGEPGYRAQRRRAAQRSGTDESVVTGCAAVGATPCALVVGEFGYLAGSVGHAAAERIIVAYERAAAEGLALIAAPVSGGTRMQEGTPAFLRMAGIAAAAAEHRAAGLPSIVLLRGPTTGGVLATWGSLGHVTFAEPGALIGFLGPRVYAEVMGRPFPKGVQTAEHLREHGVIDTVAPAADWRDHVLRFLAAATAPPAVATTGAATARPAPPHPDPGAWTRVQRTRATDRPGAAQWLAASATDITRLSGSGEGDAARGLIIALCRIAGTGAVVVGQDRAAQESGELIGPWSLRAARRAMRLAAELALPLVTLIDTPGGELSPAAEEGAMAGEIARCLADLARLPVPTVAVLLGQGAGGAAIALLPCDRVVAAENAWVTPLPPEGTAAIVHRDAARAPQMAAQQQITADALAARGVVDAVFPEEGDWLGELGRVVVQQLAGIDRDGMLARRRERWRG